MHKNNEAWLKDLRASYPEHFVGAKVLELGSRDINGSARKFFEVCKYIGVDSVAGDGVDLVLRAADLQDVEPVDTLISLSMLEHDSLWRESLTNCLFFLKKKGLLILCWGAGGNLEHPDNWKPVPHEEVIGFLIDHGIEILSSFFEEERYGIDCRGAYNVIGIKT